MLAAFASGVAEKPAPRFLLPKALGIAEQVMDGLRALPGVERVELAGSRAAPGRQRQGPRHHRRGDRPEGADGGVRRRSTSSSRRATPATTPCAGARTAGLAIDVRVVEPDQFGNLLQHFTGSKAHNMALREAAVRRGLHVSEYGILDDATGETTRCATEEEVYERLGLRVDPARAARGARRARGRGERRLPRARSRSSDLRGDVHMHTVACDGRNTIEEMAEAALARGYEYIAITDHSATHGFGNHVEPDELRRQIERVREVNDAHRRHRGADRHRDEHPPRRLARLRRRPARRARLGRSARCTPRSGWPRRR